MPLPNARWERVAQTLLKGLNITNAYRAEYGGNAVSAADNGSRLIGKDRFKARFAWLQKQVADKVLAEVPIEKIEGVRRIFAGLDYTIVDIANALNKQIGGSGGEDGELRSPTAGGNRSGGEEGKELTPEERRAALLCEEMSMTPFGPKYKITPWIGRLREIGDILGWKKQEVNVTGKLEVSGLDAIVERVRGQPFEVKFTGGK